jgi:hypothetical protein
MSARLALQRALARWEWGARKQAGGWRTAPCGAHFCDRLSTYGTE